MFQIDFLKDKPTKTVQTQRAAATVHRARFQQFIVADGCLLSGNIYTRPSCGPDERRFVDCERLREGPAAAAAMAVVVVPLDSAHQLSSTHALISISEKSNCNRVLLLNTLADSLARCGYE